MGRHAKIAKLFLDQHLKMALLSFPSYSSHTLVFKNLKNTLHASPLSNPLYTTFWTSIRYLNIEPQRHFNTKLVFCILKSK